MANSDKEKEGMNYMCGCGMWGHHWSHMIIRVLILLFVFWAGMEFGEMRGLLRASYEYGPGAMMMDNNYGWEGMHPTGMMGGYGGGAATPVVMPAAPATSATPAK